MAWYDPNLGRAPTQIEMERARGAFDRAAADRRRAMIFRMMNRGMRPGEIAQTVQLLGSQGVMGYTPMNPMVYAQIAAPWESPQVYATDVGARLGFAKLGSEERLGREGLATQRYATWLGAKSGLDQAAMQARAALLGQIAAGEQGFWASRPPVQRPESPYGAAGQVAPFGYNYAIGAGTMGAESAERLRLMAMLRSKLADPNTSEEERRIILEQLTRLASGGNVR